MKRKRKGWMASIHIGMEGLQQLFLRQRSARLLALLTAGIVLAGLILGCSQRQWLWLTLAMALLWLALTIGVAIKDVVPMLHDAKGGAPITVQQKTTGALVIAVLFALLTVGFILGPRAVDRFFGLFPPEKPPPIPAARSNDLHV